MATRDDRRAGLVLVGLAATGLIVRVLSQGGAAGGVLYSGGGDDGPGRDSLAVQAEHLARPLAPGERIDVDRASARELSRLPRIGPALAVRIVQARDERGAIGSLEALDSVPGIGPTVLRSIRGRVYFSRASSRRRQRPSVLRVSLSTAAVDELTQLPGIGPARARAIVDYRRRHGRFESVEALSGVAGIGPATIERIRRFVAP